ncbi:MAG: fructosamine kinase family protein [Niabella sp.]
MINQIIIDDIGLPVKNIIPVQGGDINESYCLETDLGKYFLKINEANQFPLLFQKEANGLNILKTQSLFAIPNVIKHGVSGNRQYLVLDWIEKAVPARDFWQQFGHKLAAMHQIEQPYFGFNEDNYIGSLTQINTIHQNWESFFTECRLMPAVKKLSDAGIFSLQDVRSTEYFGRQLQNIFPKEKPALLHGDLWGGNYMAGTDGYPVIFDPAVYFGHREMDIGMSLLFGGFSSNVYKYYNEVYPLEKNWQQRISFTQLYPLLVHAILFGGHYVHSARNILKKFDV